MPPLLELVDVSRRFPGVVALDAVSFDLQAGEVHALVGENGAGKSTLINLVGGVLAPDEGQILLDGRPAAPADPRAARRLGIAVVHQEADLFGSLSVAENMALAVGLPAGALGLVRWRQVVRDAKAAVAALGEPIDVRRPAARLGVAQRHMIQVAAAVAHGARVLVLDEPTGALSAAECAWLFDQVRRLKARGAGIVYISHRLDEVFLLADRITVLRDGRRAWSGPATSIDRAGLVRAMVGRAGAEVIDRRSRPMTGRAGDRPALRAKGFVQLDLHAGEVLGIYGLVGAGRSEWAQGVFGLRSLAAGTIEREGRPCRVRRPGDAVRAGIAYLPEDRLRQGVCPGLSVRANAVLSSLRRWARGPLADRSAEAAATREQVEALGVRLRDIGQPIGQLSGGNQQKVILGRWLLTRPRVLLLDEPTRGVDVGAKAEIHRLIRRLADDGCAVALISSELPEVLAHSDRVAVFREGRVAGFFDPRTATAEEVAHAALPEGGEPGDGLAHAASDAPPPQPSPTGGEGVRAPRVRAQTEADFSPSPPVGEGWGGGAGDRRDSPRPRPFLVLRHEVGLLVGVLALAMALALTTGGRFLTADNLLGIAGNASVLAVLAIGAAAVIIAGGIDISVGSLLALASAAGGLVLTRPGPAAIVVPLGIVAALGVGIVGGVLNAAVALLGRVHPIVVTLGTLTIYRGLLMGLTGGDVITGLPAGFRRLATGHALGVPGAALILLAAALAAHVGLAHTRPGRHLYALGSNPDAARLVGIARRRGWPLAFGAGGLCAALAGLLELAQDGSMQATLGTGYELRAIAAAVIGGAAVDGGRGGVAGVLLGALLLGLIQNGLVLWEVSRYRYDLVLGALLLAAILLDLAVRRLAR
jgi:rhamnose transport system ATP-binding protein